MKGYNAYMSDLDKLEEGLINQLFWRARIMEELIALAFVDVGDYIVIDTEKQVVSLHPNINQMDMRGIEILQGKDSLTVRAPYRMQALGILWRYFNNGDDSEDSLRLRIAVEREKIKKLREG